VIKSYLMRTPGWLRPVAMIVGLISAATACQPGRVALSDRGGALTIAAWEPDCADPLLPCSINSWGGAIPSMTLQTLPRVFDGDNGLYVPNVLLAGPPLLEVGPPQRVTYHINRRAVWSDGQPITSSDFRFTWSEYLREKNISGPLGYDKVTSIDDSDPRTTVVTYGSPDADWQDLFFGLLPKHLLEGRDRHALMKDGYRWSGGPWLIDSWTKGRSIVLVPNRRFWGQRPKLDRVVFSFVTDDVIEEQAYRSGRVDVIAPIGRSSRADLRALPNTNFEFSPSLDYELLQFNIERPPLNDKAVRQALAYATDRAAIAKADFDLAPDLAPIDSFSTLASPFYVDAFSRYQRNLQKVDQIMRADGWRRAPDDGIWSREGHRAALEFSTFDGWPFGRAEIEGKLLQSEWREAGFDLTLKPMPYPALADHMGRGNYSTLSFFYLNFSISPSECSIWCSENIPPTGDATSRLRSPTVDDLWHRVDTELDQTRRMALVTQAQRALADEVPALPLASTPNIVYWRTTVGGPIAANNPFGPFMNLNQWYCKGGRCSTS
jgi:peptide/nickel transport system substrate-binding protein